MEVPEHVRRQRSRSITLPDTPGSNFSKQHLRVYTFGRFQIEWVDPAMGQVTPFPPERFHGQNAATALGLFKALLSCPDRFATRAWLNEQFWPNSKQRSAEERLNDVASSLRTLLRPQGSREMLVHFVYGTSGRGAGYRLEAYPYLWCDADAFEWYVKHALLLDQRGQDATACWEHAYALAERGMYLPEQIEDDWSRPRRDYLNGLVRDCIRRGTVLLWQMGHIDEAIMRLRSYWLDHVTDEDALRPLIDMLGECGRFREAEECYAKALAALVEESHLPDDRTTDAIEIVRALKVQSSSQYPFFKTPAGLSLDEVSTPFFWKESQAEESGIRDFLRPKPKNTLPELLSENASALRASINDHLNMELFQQFSQVLGFSSSLHAGQLDLLEQQTLCFGNAEKYLLSH